MRTLCSRDKNRLPVTPILSSILRLVRYHMGTVAKGSFIITLVKIPRLILMYIHKQLKGKVGGASASIAALTFVWDNAHFLCQRFSFSFFEKLIFIQTDDEGDEG